jgi:hypothetical protein
VGTVALSAIDLRGRALHSARFIHGEIYKVRPDVNAEASKKVGFRAAKELKLAV